MNRKKVTHFLIIFILGIGIIGCKPHRHTAPIYSGKINASLASKTYVTEHFQVAVVAENEANFSIQITHQENPSKILWETLPGEGFLFGGMGIEEIHEKKGSFFVRETELDICNQQTLSSVSQKNNQIVFAGSLQCKDQKTVSYTFTLEEHSAQQLSFEGKILEDGYNRLYLTYASQANERFFGFGEQFTYFDMKGKQLPILVMEQGVGRGEQPISFFVDIAAKSAGEWHTSYAGVPHYVTSEMRSLFLKNNEHSIFDMTQSDKVQISLFSNTMQGRIIYGESPLELIEEYTTYSGRMRELPDWIHNGAILGMQGGTEKVMSYYKQLKAKGGPVSALWLQDWVGQRTTSFGKQLWWNWELDQDHYPGWKDMVSELKADDVRVLTYINPFFADMGPVTKEEKATVVRNQFQELADQGFLVKTQDDAPYLIENTSFSAGLIDLSNPQAREWVKDVIKEELIAVGSSGWMADFGEALPFDGVLANADAREYHNRYAEEWQQVNREAIIEAGRGDDIVFFSRSGYTLSPGKTTLFWLGDQLVTWSEYDGIKTAVTGLLSGGISGYALNHSDIGGYTTIPTPWYLPVSNYYRSKELELRWIELNAFTSVFRTHEGNRPSVNHQFNSDEETLDQFVRFSKVYKAWKFYRVSLVKTASESGHPVIRHPWIHYPQNERFYEMSYQQFMIGDELMVIPVLDPGKKTVQAYLPQGTWVNLFTQEKVNADGKQEIQVNTPIGTPAVFYQEGSAVGKQFYENLKQEGVL